MPLPEILAPAGDMTCLTAAINAGADAIYIGLEEFNMRERASANFARTELPEATRRCREHGVKLYLTLNSIIFEDEFPAVRSLIEFARDYVDAFIVADWGVVTLCREIGVTFHVSTQMSTSNSRAVKFLLSQGAARIVLARECTLAEAAHIIKETGAEVETFVHGAQCVAVSGRCFLSHHAYGCSANRGQCHQPCRRRFIIKAVDRYADSSGAEVHPSDTAFEITPHTVMSAKDLCSLGFVDKLMAAGIASFKIEGRARNPEYVRATVAAYRAAVDAVSNGSYTPELVAQLTTEVKKVFHREFAEGLYFGRPGAEQFTDTEDSVATTVKKHIGIVEDYFLKAGVAQVRVQDNALELGVTVQIHGPTTGVVETTITSLRRDSEAMTRVGRGEWATFPCPRVRVGDKCFLIAQR